MDLTAHPDSAVPSAFDRGHLYSPTLTQTRWALDGRYDYRPGNDFEPMPDSPRGDGKAWAWWRTNIALVPAVDFLGLYAGDEITLHCLNGYRDPATVTATFRYGALVRFPLPVSHSNPDGTRTAERYVRCRNDHGDWY